ncbi:MAG: hypothetical protein M5R36_26910 [Deltaproteobacteria bacterium]|nr:hypothetical protein [Deltaproteobacteria bacterium]
MTSKLFFRSLAVAALLSALVVFGWVACGGDDDDDDDDDGEEEIYDPEPDDFVSDIDSGYFMFVVGSHLKFDGTDGVSPVYIDQTVPGDTETVTDIECLVVVQELWVDNELVTTTRNFFAQNWKSKEIMLFGQDVEDADGGDAGSWRLGDNQPVPGSVWPADVEVGAQFSPWVKPNFNRYQAEITDLGISRDTPPRDFDDVAEVEERDLENDRTRTAYYANGFGLIGFTFDGGGAVTLVSIEGQ